MRFVSIEGRRDGYSPDQCSETMTVGELRDYLANFDEDLPIYLCNDKGYTYGSIDKWSIDEDECGEDKEDEEE